MQPFGKVHGAGMPAPNESTLSRKADAVFEAALHQFRFSLADMWRGGEEGPPVRKP